MDAKVSSKKQSQEALRRQSLQMEALSTPIMILWNSILFLPIIGIIDTRRSQAIMDEMLSKIEETQSKVVILDILGVLTVDTAVANHLIKVTKATALLGCNCIITGISAEISKTIVELGVDLGAVMTQSTLKNGVIEAFDLIGVQVTSIKEAPKKVRA